MSSPVKSVLVTLATAVSVCGPLMVCVGIALAITPSDRPVMLDEYNGAVTAYNAANPAGIADAINATTQRNRVNVNFPLTLRTADVKAIRITDGVDAATSSLLSTTVQYNPTGITVVGTQFSLNPATITRSPPLYTIAIGYADCKKPEGCTHAEMVTYCQTTYDAAAQFTGPNPTCPFGLCYECGYPSFLDDVCVVVQQQADGSYADHHTLKSCYYPFTAATARYGKKRPDGSFIPSYTATVRRADDPFLTMQRLTEGTMDFGPDSSSDMRAGIGLVVVGGVFTVVTVFMLHFWFRAYTGALEAQRSEDRVLNNLKKFASSDVPMAAVGGVIAAANSVVQGAAIDSVSNANEPSTV